MTTTTTNNNNTNNNDNNASNDIAASTYHLHDLLDDPPPLDSTAPVRVTMQSPSLRNFPAYMTSARVITTTTTTAGRDRLSSSGSNAGGPLPPEWASPTPEPVADSATVSIHLLVVRMQSSSTDLLVQVNVPWKEFHWQTDAIAREEAAAKEIMACLVNTLDVRDFGLFGEEDE